MYQNPSAAAREALVRTAKSHLEKSIRTIAPSTVEAIIAWALLDIAENLKDAAPALLTIARKTRSRIERE
jgi:hypothetical protein